MFFQIKLFPAQTALSVYRLGLWSESRFQLLAATLAHLGRPLCVRERLAQPWQVCVGANGLLQGSVNPSQDSMFKSVQALRTEVGFSWIKCFGWQSCSVIDCHQMSFGTYFTAIVSEHGFCQVKCHVDCRYRWVVGQTMAPCLYAFAFLN